MSEVSAVATRAPETALDGVAASLLAGWLAREGGLLLVKDAATGRYLHADNGMARFLGRAAADLIGQQDADFFDAATCTALRAADHTALAQGTALWSDHRLPWQGRACEFEVLRVVEGAGPARRIASLWLDRAEARQRELQLRSALEQLEQQQRANSELRRELADQALRDPASGLYTRAHFEDQLKREVDLSTREHREFALVVIELDPPSEAVMAAGAAARAQILDAVGRLLRGGTRAMDASCRYDENRFAVLLSGVGLATAHSRMESLRRRCATQIVVLQGQELNFTVSMGVASYPHTAQTLADLVASSELALAEARRRGGNHITLAAIRLEGL